MTGRPWPGRAGGCGERPPWQPLGAGAGRGGGSGRGALAGAAPAPGPAEQRPRPGGPPRTPGPDRSRGLPWRGRGQGSGGGGRAGRWTRLFGWFLPKAPPGAQTMGGRGGVGAGGGTSVAPGVMGARAATGDREPQQPPQRPGSRAGDGGHQAKGSEYTRGQDSSLPSGVTEEEDGGSAASQQFPRSD